VVRRDAACALVALALTGLAGVGTGTARARGGPPPMGWNSWNSFGRGISENLIRREADAMVASGMRDAGYRYLTIDGGWRAPERDAGGNLVAHPERFPNGMKAIADYVHAKGLELGLHQPMGMTDCGGESPRTQSAPGGERQDAELLASWGVDYVKYDRCAFALPAGTSPPAPDLDRITVRRGAEVVGSYEAETPGNRLGGRAVVSPCAPMPGQPAGRGACSGERVAGIGIDGGSLRFEDVTVPADGDYELDLRFVLPNYGQARGYINSSYGGIRADVRVDDDLPLSSACRSALRTSRRATHRSRRRSTTAGTPRSRGPSLRACAPARRRERDRDQRRRLRGGGATPGRGPDGRRASGHGPADRLQHLGAESPMAVGARRRRPGVPTATSPTAGTAPRATGSSRPSTAGRRWLGRPAQAASTTPTCSWSASRPC
jgi:hypothetical protein